MGMSFLGHLLGQKEEKKKEEEEEEEEEETRMKIRNKSKACACVTYPLVASVSVSAMLCIRTDEGCSQRAGAGGRLPVPGDGMGETN